MAIKLVRTSEKVYKQLQEIAKTEDISLREALDILAETRDKLDNQVNQSKKEIDTVKSDLEYIFDALDEKNLIPEPKDLVAPNSVLKRYRFLR